MNQIQNSLNSFLSLIFLNSYCSLPFYYYSNMLYYYYFFIMLYCAVIYNIFNTCLKFFLINYCLIISFFVLIIIILIFRLIFNNYLLYFSFLYLYKTLYSMAKTCIIIYVLQYYFNQIIYITLGKYSFVFKICYIKLLLKFLLF